MPDRTSYCRSCFRELPEDVFLCPACASRDAVRPSQKIAIVLGLCAIPFVLTGIASLNARACIIGMAIAATAAVVYALLSLR